jgi:hypothetical protein
VSCLGHPRLSNEEIDRRGEALYAQRIRSLVETDANQGKMMVIDVETGDYEVDDDGLAASDWILARHPDAAMYALRIGCDAVYSFGGAPVQLKQ